MSNSLKLYYLSIIFHKGIIFSIINFIKQQRIVFLDYVRVFACFLVLVAHASENFYGAIGASDMAGPQSFLQNEADRLWVSLYDGFSRMSVPLLGIYLFIPVISPWLRKVSAKEERFFILLFLISTCIPYLNRWFGEVWGQCFWNEYHMLWYFSGYLGYLVTAHYIRTHLTWDRTKRLVIGAISMTIGAALTIFSFYTQAVPGQILETPVIEIGWAFCTINCVLLTIGAFLMFTCIRQKETPKLIEDMSKMSFGIYLMHIFWLGLWVSVFKNNLALPTVAAIPAISVATFISSYLATKLISFIPGSKWIIG